MLNVPIPCRSISLISFFFFVKNTVALRFFSSAGKQVCLCSKAKGGGK